MVTQGLAVSVTSSGVMSGSTSTGLVVAISTSWHAGPVRASTALLTDHYELTMLEAALESGMASRRSVFELYGRRLPEGRRYGVVAGVGRALEGLEDFRFDDDVLQALEPVVDERTRDWLAGHRFSGDIWGYAEGDLY